VIIFSVDGGGSESVDRLDAGEEVPPTHPAIATDSAAAPANRASPHPLSFRVTDTHAPSAMHESSGMSARRRL
jgi:hypothetical protein